MKLLGLGFVLALVSCSPSPCFAEVSESVAVLCILGEAEGESLEGQTAVAEAMRNRITKMGRERALKGVYGCKAVKESGGVYRRGKRIIPDYAVKRAFRAWEASKGSNYTLKGTHWESTDFKKPYWADSMILTATVGKHEFYKIS
jgi:hypothetical protein